MTAGRPVRRKRALGPDDTGVAAVEFALVLPLLVVLLFTIVMAGSVYVDQLQIQSAARNSARIGSVLPASACAQARAELSTNSVGTIDCQLLENCSTGNVKVRLTARQVVSIPIVGSKDVTLRATSSYVCPSGASSTGVAP